MTIQTTDIKLLESQRMTDTTDGGGRMTSTEIPDNVAGNLFPKISRLDAVYGRVNLRKIFMAVKTANLDVYGGANMVQVDPPDNPKVGVLLFSTGSDFDTRTDARDRIESYVIKGVKSRMKLFGDQIVGQKAILVYQKTSEPLPEIGEVYLLSVEKVGYTPAEQYVRVTDLKYEDREFTVSVGSGGEVTFTRRVITLGIGYPLIQTFDGAEVTYLEDTGSPTVVRETNVADAAKYYGIQAFGGAFQAGSFTIKAASLYAPIVPSTNRETAVSMAQVGGAAQYAACSDATNVMPLGAYPPKKTFFVRSTSGFDFQINGNAIALFGPTVRTGSFSGRDFVFTEDTLTYSGSSDFTITKTLGAFCAPVQQPPHTRAVPITLATQGTVYSEALNPIPAPGSLTVDYRSLGRWYRLQDDGTGKLADLDGNTAIGSGSISYIDGSLVVTLGALPDVGSSLLLSWASPAHYERLSVSTPTIDPPKITGTLAADAADNAIVPGSVSVTWGAGLTCTDDGHGNLTGSGTGSINYVARQYSLTPTALPAPNTVFQWAYNQAPQNASSPAILTGTISGTQLTLSAVGGGNLKPGSMQLTLQGTTVNVTRTYMLADDGNGNLKSIGTNVYYANPAGTVNYSTGDVVVYGSNYSTAVWSGASSGGGLGWVVSSSPVALQPTVTARFSLTSDPFTAKTDQTTLAALTIDLTPYTANSVVPASLLFSCAGRQYYDKNGTLYDQFDPTTGSGVVAGSVDYAQGVATLTEWVDASSPAITLQAGLTKFGDFWVYESSFRTPGSPLRPASLYIQISTADGRLLTGTADQNGTITGPEMAGTVQQDMGVVDVKYGLMVADSSLTADEKAEPWYDPADVVGGQIFKPTKCMPETLRFSCVVLAQLPLDPTLLGLDPVRLPKDGRVPIYRPGDVVVLLNTQDDTAATLTAGQTITLSRNDIAVFSILDANGKRLDPALYTADLAAGIVTMASPIDLSAYVAPYKLRHRREEMNLIGGTQIDGTLELSSPTQYDHDATSYVASALLFGDMQAAYTGLFDQQTWTGVWSDTLIGSAANATYDDLNHPIEVLNNGAVTERWRINFTSATAFQVVGENLGIIATGDTSTDVSVVNSLTGQPYFVLRAAGWGLGWAAGNQLRFNTTGATAPVWLARTILSGASVTGDSFSVERRGDID